MKELALASMTTTDRNKNVFRRFNRDDLTYPNLLGFYGGFLKLDSALGYYENPMAGIVRLLGEQTSLDMRPEVQITLGPYSNLIVPAEYTSDREPAKVHFFQTVLRASEADLEKAYRETQSVLVTNSELLMRHDVVPMVRFILEQIDES